MSRRSTGCSAFLTPYIRACALENESIRAFGSGAPFRAAPLRRHHRYANWGEDRGLPQARHGGNGLIDLDSEHRAFHEAVLDYCLEVVEQARAPTSAGSRSLAFWGTLALMRCVGSSPAAAASALRNRLAADPDRLEEQVFDDDADETDAIDVEPTSGASSRRTERSRTSFVSRKGSRAPATRSSTLSSSC